MDRGYPCEKLIRQLSEESNYLMRLKSKFNTEIDSLPLGSNMLGICSKKVYELIHSGAISVISCGKVYKAAKISVIDYILKNNNVA